MDIQFRAEQFERECNTRKLLVKKHGEVRAKLISRRLDALRAATMLEELRNAPGRLHELRGDRKGQLSMDLDGPYRLLLTPSRKPYATRPDGGMDWTSVTAVTVLGIEDTHD